MAKIQWHLQEIEGHQEAIKAILAPAKRKGRPLSMAALRAKHGA